MGDADARRQESELESVAPCTVNTRCVCVAYLTGRNVCDTDPSNVISTFFGTGAAESMSESGAMAFKRQLYQSMVGQLLFLKTEIEGWRSQNVWGEWFPPYLQL